MSFLHDKEKMPYNEDMGAQLYDVLGWEPSSDTGRFIGSYPSSTAATSKATEIMKGSQYIRACVSTYENGKEVVVFEVNRSDRNISSRPRKRLSPLTKEED